MVLHRGAKFQETPAPAVQPRRVAAAVVLGADVEIDAELFAELERGWNVEDHSVAGVIERVEHNRAGDRQPEARSADRYRHGLCRQRGDKIFLTLGTHVQQVRAQFDRRTELDHAGRAEDGDAIAVGCKRAPGLELARPCLSDLRVIDVVRAAEPRRESRHGGDKAENNGEHESARWDAYPRAACKAGARWFGVTHGGTHAFGALLWEEFGAAQLVIPLHRNAL
jgi:hypothetical protein